MMLPFNEVKQEALRLRAEKKTCAEIGLLLKRTPSTIWFWVKKVPFEKKLSNKEIGHRVCIYCNCDKPNEDYNKTSYGNPKPYCRQCQKEKRIIYYQNNKQAIIKKQVARTARNRAIVKEKVAEYLEKHPCIQCGEKDIVVLDFHHRDSSTKESEICQLIVNGYSWKKLLTEIKKCDILCANCHRRITARERGFFRFERQ